MLMYSLDYAFIWMCGGVVFMVFVVTLRSYDESVRGSEGNRVNAQVILSFMVQVMFAKSCPSCHIALISGMELL